MQNSINREIQSWYESWYSIDRYYAEWAQRKGLTDNSFYILRTVFECSKPCTSHYLCEKLMLSKQTVSSALDSLSAKGYLTRRTNPSDRRNRLIVLTETGESFARQLWKELHAAEQKAFAGMDESSRRGLIEGNRILAEQLRQSLSEE